MPLPDLTSKYCLKMIQKSADEKQAVLDKIENERLKKIAVNISYLFFYFHTMLLVDLILSTIQLQRQDSFRLFPQVFIGFSVYDLPDIDRYLKIAREYD